MSKSSEKVKRWRRRTKERLVKAMGGECICCEYKKCTDALEFHHRDKDQKERTLAGIRASVMAWSKIVEEARKCVLVCSNCHKEIHAGVTLVPDDAVGFDESYADYKLMESDESCPVCGGEKPLHRITCGKKCAAKRRVDWSKIDLLEMVKSFGIAGAADKIGVSYAAVQKRLKKI